MALDVAVSSADTPARPRPIPLGRVAAIPAGWLLAGLVGLSFAVRWLLAAAHTTPVYFPDEYIYSAIARSLAEGDGIAIRGHAAGFPALLQPILNAPFWLFDEPAVAYRLTQGLNALAMSLAAVPVYLIAPAAPALRAASLGCALLAVVTPNLFYVSYVLGEPIAYPLVLGAVYFGIRAISQPTRWRADGARRVQRACRVRARAVRRPAGGLPRSPRRSPTCASVKRLRLTLVLFALPLLGALALGPMRVLGYYSRIANLDVHPLEMAGWGATDLMLLAYSSGWVLVPGAVVGLAYALWKPRSRDEKAFGALAVLLVGALLLEATLYAANAAEAAGGGRFQERYLMTILPLVAPAFCLWLTRGAPRGGSSRSRRSRSCSSRLASRSPPTRPRPDARTRRSSSRSTGSRRGSATTTARSRSRRRSPSSRCSPPASRSGRAAPRRSRSAPPSCSPRPPPPPRSRSTPTTCRRYAAATFPPTRAGSTTRTSGR